jgi:hypothetical protein
VRERWGWVAEGSGIVRQATTTRVNKLQQRTWQDTVPLWPNFMNGFTVHLKVIGKKTLMLKYSLELSNGTNY